MSRHALFALVLCLGAAGGAAWAQELSPDAVEQMQRIYMREQGKQLDQLATQIVAGGDTALADTNLKTFSSPSPGGGHLLVALSRTSPEIMDRWLFLVLEPRTFTVTTVFDFLSALGIEKLAWLDENRFVVLARTKSLAGPPGPLWYVNLVSGKAEALADLVWKVAVSPSGDDLVYERQENPDEPYGDRSIWPARLSTGERTQIRKVTHPTTQFGLVGPFEAEGTFCRFAVDTYGTDSFVPSRTEYCYDLMANRSFEVPPRVPVGTR